MIRITYENNFEKQTKDFQNGKEERVLSYLRKLHRDNLVGAKGRDKMIPQTWFLRVTIIKI